MCFSRSFVHRRFGWLAGWWSSFWVAADERAALERQQRKHAPKWKYYIRLKRKQNYSSTSRVRWAKLHCVPVRPAVVVQLSADISPLWFLCVQQFLLCHSQFSLTLCLVLMLARMAAYKNTASQLICMRGTLNSLLFGTFDAGRIGLEIANPHWPANTRRESHSIATRVNG